MTVQALEKKIKKVEQDLYQFQQDFNKLCATVLRIRKALLDFLDHYSVWGLSSDSGYLKKISKELKEVKK